MAATTGDGRLVIIATKPPTKPACATSRHQPRSFHSAIWASKANHAKVTAYDIAVGRGRAVTDPFYRTCARWRTGG
jgi:hypothetical protein